MSWAIYDPGHGGVDSGAVGPGGTRESDVNLSIAWQAYAATVMAHGESWLTRWADGCLSLANRAAQANYLDNAGAFVSIHCNSNGPDAHGFEVYHFPHSPAGITLATAIRDAVAHEVPALAMRGDRNGLKADGRLAVLRKTKMPAVLVECAFLSNPNEEAWLAKVETQVRLGRTIAGATMAFLAGRS